MAEPSSVTASAINRMLSHTQATEGYINLRIGEPDFQTPAHVVEAGIQALRDGFTKYSQPVGFVSTREIIREKLIRENGYDTAIDNIMVTCGSSPATCMAIGAVAQKGDEILVPDPGWPNYETFASTLGIASVRYNMHPGKRSQIDFDQLQALVTPRTKLLVINSPSNPTGAVSGRKECEAIVEFARRNKIYLLSDEAYESIVFDGPATSPASLDATDITFSCYTLSKTYAMTGWRVGYIACPEQFRGPTYALQLTINGCAPVMGQKAAEAAISGPQDIVQEMCASYKKRRDLCVEALSGTSALEYPPAGAFYLWLDVATSGKTGAEFNDLMRLEQKVLISSGDTYTTQDNHHVRLSLASKQEDLLEGVRRIASYLK